MTGQPAFTFRDTDDVPRCQACDRDMVFRETVEGEHNERDVYECGDCGDQYIDRWTF